MWVLSVKCYDTNYDCKCAWHRSPSSTSQKAPFCACAQRGQYHWLQVRWGAIKHRLATTASEGTQKA